MQHDDGFRAGAAVVVVHLHVELIHLEADEVAGGGKGVSLRFPRFIKERDDKKPDEASTAKLIAEMYQRQESVGKNKGPSADDDFEY